MSCLQRCTEVKVQEEVEQIYQTFKSKYIKMNIIISISIISSIIIISPQNFSLHEFTLQPFLAFFRLHAALPKLLPQLHPVFTFKTKLFSAFLFSTVFPTISSVNLLAPSAVKNLFYVALQIMLVRCHVNIASVFSRLRKREFSHKI